MMTVISEAGLYSLILGSKLPSAQAFKHWVTSEVLPSIRKTGSYNTLAYRIPCIPPSYSEALRLIGDQYYKQAALEEEVRKLQPKAEYCDDVLRSDGALPITVIAAQYGMTAQAMNRKLCQMGIQRKVGKVWVLRAEYVDQGYTRSTSAPACKERQIPYRTYNRWTRKGEFFLYHKLKEQGIVPMKEQETPNKQNRAPLQLVVDNPGRL